MSDIGANSLEHSFEGISVLNQFNETSVMLYVEGDDDIPFWKHLFKKYAPKNFCEIEQTHGKKGLEQYKEGIKDGTLHNVMVACDSDYSCISSNTTASHPLIVTTYGHSIENSMFCKPMLADYIARLSTSTADYQEEVEHWVSVIENDAYRLLLIDILNDQKPDGQSCKCLTSGFSRYSDGKGKLRQTEVDKIVNEANQTYSSDDFDNAEAKLASLSKPRFKIFQGHFIEGAVNEFIRAMAHCTLSRKAIYGEFSVCRGFCTTECEDRLFAKKEIEDAVNFVKNNNYR